jgi:hypothetical protein
MQQQRVRIHADRSRLGIKNHPVGRARKSKPTPTNPAELHRAYSPLVAFLAEIALTKSPKDSSE